MSNVRGRGPSVTGVAAGWQGVGMLIAGWWGFVGGAALILGAVLALVRPFSARTIGLVMAFGAGVLISALAFELTKDAYDQSGAREVVMGLALGAGTFYLGDRWLDRVGGKHRKRSSGKQAGPGDDAKGLVLGALLDGIPESAAIGITLVGGKSVGVAVVAAVFLSNVPESMSAATGLLKAGHSKRWILVLWTSVALMSGIVAAVAYAVLGGSDPAVLAVIQAFAAGAILTMLADTMMPEAFENGGTMVGLVTTSGFALAFLLSQVS
jgi:zinc transporter, ZIP family